MSSTDVCRIDLERDAQEEAGRLAIARRYRFGDVQPGGAIPLDRPWLAASRRPGTRMRLRPETLTIYQAALVDGSGRCAEATLAGVTSARTGAADHIDSVCAHFRSWEAEARRVHERFVRCRLDRERTRRAELEARADCQEVQPGLFDHRAIAERSLLEQEWLQIDAELKDRLDVLGDAQQVELEIHPVLVLVT
jgi:hypothetical protein